MATALLSKPEVRDLKLKEILTCKLVHRIEVLLRSRPRSGLFTGYQMLHNGRSERDTLSVTARIF